MLPDFFLCFFSLTKKLLRFDFDFDFNSIRSVYRKSHLMLMLSNRWSKQTNKGCWWRRTRACCACYYSRNAAVFKNASVRLVPHTPKEFPENMELAYHHMLTHDSFCVIVIRPLIESQFASMDPASRRMLRYCELPLLWYVTILYDCVYMYCVTSFCKYMRIHSFFFISSQISIHPPN